MFIFTEFMEQMKQEKFEPYFLPTSILLAALITAGAWVYTAKFPVESSGWVSGADTEKLQAQILPADGVELPVRWGNLGAQLVKAGVIDEEKFSSLYEARGGMDEQAKALLTASDNGVLRITQENAPVLLNLFWALGLANKNEILEKGPMADPRYGDPGRFASTGGWTLARGDPSINSGQAAMDHYSKHRFIILAPDQQDLVARVAQNIYRPCCNNPTHFPDCNHGMAMLGLLELMAAQGVNEEEMYRAALAVNAFWFPDTYLTIAAFLESRGIAWESADPRELLGKDFSSATGYRQILSQMAPQQDGSGSSCGV